MHKFSDLSVARAAPDFAENTKVIVRRGCGGDRIVTSRERRCHKLREGNMARRVMAMMLGVPRMTRHEASIRGPWGPESKKGSPGRLVPPCVPLAMPRKNDRSLITRNRPDP